MGVPVITLRGDRHAGRVGASILTRVGLNELIAESTDDYVSLAAQLAADRQRRIDLRNDIRDRMCNAPICDAPAFAASVEAAFTEMWQQRSGELVSDAMARRGGGPTRD